MNPNDSRLEDMEFEVWKEMESFSVQQLRAELNVTNILRQYTAAKYLQLKGASRETFIYLTDLLRCENESYRKVAVFCLGQLGTPDRPFSVETVPLLVDLAKKNIDLSVRAEVISALGHLKDNSCFEYLADAANDKDAGIRACVAFALGNIHDKRGSVPLLKLTYDADDEVASWAILGLRLLDVSSLDVRNRLFELVTTTDDEVSENIICALARWQDLRILSVLIDKLNQDEINAELFEAAGNLGDKKALPRLKQLLDDWGDDSPKLLKQAILKLEAQIN
ncbi:HEAT repeat domain-containing protein [Undibacterium sp. Tian12W]|uniref:HEAT repeat domain-containing protein n=1 Tax=Undibacterium sp. Tian12W TaxID=3413054 RepID=UPI003BF25BE5